jgi:hypothetical protein
VADDVARARRGGSFTYQCFTVGQRTVAQQHRIELEAASFFV